MAVSSARCPRQDAATMTALDQTTPAHPPMHERLLALRKKLPLLERRIEGQPLIYLDNAATSLTPQPVVDAMVHYLEQVRGNIHRGKHLLSEEASEAYEAARQKVAGFVGAAPGEVVFTLNTTMAINMVVLGLGLVPGDNVVTSSAEHHAALLPLQGRTEMRFVDVGADGVLDVDRLFSLVDARTRLLVLGHASNVTGAVHPMAAIGAEARRRGVKLLVDGAQSVPHVKTDLHALGADFLAFSGHKMMGPPGIGVLCGRRESLDGLDVVLRGGGAVRLVTRQGATEKASPFRFEAGTPNIVGAIGLGAAVDVITAIGVDVMVAHEALLAERLRAGCEALPGVKLLGPSTGHRLPIASLALTSPGLSADDVALILSDTHKVMVRSGHHCCHPYFDGLGLSGAVRASAHAYTSVDDVDAFLDAARTVLRALGA